MITRTLIPKYHHTHEHAHTQTFVHTHTLYYHTLMTVLHVAHEMLRASDQSPYSHDLLVTYSVRIVWIPGTDWTAAGWFTVTGVCDDYIVFPPETGCFNHNSSRKSICVELKPRPLQGEINSLMWLVFSSVWPPPSNTINIFSFFLSPHLLVFLWFTCHFPFYQVSPPCFTASHHLLFNPSLPLLYFLSSPSPHTPPFLIISPPSFSSSQLHNSISPFNLSCTLLLSLFKVISVFTVIVLRIRHCSKQ